MTRTELDAERVAKLPRWAQAHIRKVEHERDAYRAASSDVTEPGAPWTVSFGWVDGADVLREFNPRSVEVKIEGGRLSLSLRDGRLEIQGNGSRFSDVLSIRPHVSNVVSVGFDAR